MVYRSNISLIIELSESEGGVFTAAQAVRFGITRNALSNAVSSGRLERVVHGAYRMAGVPASRTDELVAVWKLTDPSAFSYERLARWDGVTAGGTTASNVLGIGDFFLSPYRLYTARRFNSRLSVARFSIRAVDEDDVAIVSGVPVTKPERTVVDLTIDREDPSLVEDALADALRGGEWGFDVSRFEMLLKENVARVGQREADRLLSIAAAPLERTPV